MKSDTFTIYFIYAHVSSHFWKSGIGALLKFENCSHAPLKAVKCLLCPVISIQLLPTAICKHASINLPCPYHSLTVLLYYFVFRFNDKTKCLLFTDRNHFSQPDHVELPLNNIVVIPIPSQDQGSGEFVE